MHGRSKYTWKDVKKGAFHDDTEFDSGDDTPGDLNYEALIGKYLMDAVITGDLVRARD